MKSEMVMLKLIVTHGI